MALLGDAIFFRDTFQVTGFVRGERWWAENLTPSSELTFEVFLRSRSVEGDEQACSAPATYCDSIIISELVASFALGREVS